MILTDTVIKRITDIRIQEKRKNRVSVFINDEFAFGLDQNVLIKSGIARGDELDESRIREVLAMEDLKQANDKAVRLLAVRARSIHELRDRLLRDKLPADIVEQVINEFIRLGLLNDTEFAVMFARNRMITKPSGRILLINELKAKGLGQADIDKGLEAAYSEQGEYDYACEVAVKAKKRYRKREEDAAKKKTTEFLLRRGFNWDHVKDIIENWEHIDEE